MALLTLSDALYGHSAMAVNELTHIHSPKIQLQNLILHYYVTTRASLFYSLIFRCPVWEVRSLPRSR
jgi:hypothetical protein